MIEAEKKIVKSIVSVFPLRKVLEIVVMVLGYIIDMLDNKEQSH